MAEAGLVELEAAAGHIAEYQPISITIKHIVKTRINNLIERLSAEKLAELDSLLADFDTAYLNGF